MKLPRLITRRRVKWVGMVASLSIAIAYVTSIWASAGVWRIGESGSWGVTVEHGSLLVAKSSFGPGEPRLPANFGFEHGATKGIWVYLWFDRQVMQIIGAGMSAKSVFVTIPLWPAFLLIALPTAYLWQTDRRAKPWQCPKCRYDLRGLDGGVCPECGHELKPSIAEGMAD